VSSTVAYTREGIAAGDQIAERMANVGDVDHDSYTDLLVSSIAYQNGRHPGGRGAGLALSRLEHGSAALVLER
jgi:hypothetical protein